MNRAPPGIDVSADTDVSALALLQEALEYSSEDFANGDEVDGANLVEWFSGWRRRAERFLEAQQANRRDPHSS